MSLLIIPYMAWLSRMCGGAPPKLPLGLDQWLYALGYLALWPIAGPWALAAYAGGFIGKRLGHGRGMSLKEPMKQGADPERVEALILWLQPYMPVYWYKALVLALTGAAEVVLAVIVLGAYGAWPQAAVMAAAGFVGKPLAYIIGWGIYPQGSGKGIPQLDEATRIGEFLYGAFIGLGLFFVLVSPL